jgi:hypothetical protein
MSTFNIAFAPLFPLPVILGLALIAAGLIALGWRWKMHGRGFRALVMLAFLAALANPVIIQRQSKPLSDYVFLVIDTSPSQHLDNRLERSETAARRLAKQLAKYPDLEVKTIRAGNTGQGTRLFPELAPALARVPPERVAGIIMITDGQVHDIPKAGHLKEFTSPVHALITGNHSEFDRRLIVERAPRFGLIGKPLNLVFSIEDKRTGPNKLIPPARVNIWVNGKKTMTRQISVNTRVNLPLIIEHRGENIIEIETEAVPGELTNRNNRTVLAINGIRERLRVLLVSGAPHAGERTWRRLLKSDPMVDLVHFTILRPPEKQDSTPIDELSLIAFPVRELFVEKLKAFDLVIFDRYQRRNVLPLVYLENVAEYVRRGGAILIAAGPAFASPFSLFRTPLSTILPGSPSGKVLETPYRPQITSLGQRHPVTRSLPGGDMAPPEWGRWFRLIEAKAARGNTLMSGPDNRPLLLLSREGKGRVALLLSDHAWLWTRGYEGGGPQAELLRRLAHWLMKEPDLEEEALKVFSREGKIIIERRSLRGEVPFAKITSPSGKITKASLREFAPGIFRSIIAARETGFYRVSNGKLNAITATGQINAREFKDVRATGKILRPLTKATGGAIKWLAPANPNSTIALPAIRMLKSGRIMSGSGWIGLKRGDAEKLLGQTRLPLFSGLLAIAFLLGLSAVAWRKESY